MAESALPLDPLSPYVNTCLGLALFTRGQAAEAIEALDRALDMEPDFLYTLWVLGGAASACGQPWAKPCSIRAHAKLGRSSGEAQAKRRRSSATCSAVSSLSGCPRSRRNSLAVSSSSSMA